MTRFLNHRLASRAALAGVCALATLLAACGDTASDDAGDTGPKTTAEQVKKEVREAAKAIKSFTFEQKDEFSEWGKKRIGRLDTRLDELRKRGSDLAGEAKTEWEGQIADLEKRKKELEAQLDATVESTSESWSELSKGFADAQKELAKAIREAGKELGDGTGDDEEVPADES